jgi:uncharacterized protein
MKIGIISDTHDQIEKIKKAIKTFNTQKVNLVYHLGDICSPFTLQLYGELKCPLKGVFGNNDSDIFKILKSKPKNAEFFDKLYVDEVSGKKICLFHGDPKEIVEMLFESDEYDILLTGHDHVAKIRQGARTMHINPGNLIGRFSDSTKAWTQPSIAVLDVDKTLARIIHI